jgi:RNA polymerase subunit RPABC4/transcription elongation factor Spt4
MRIAGKCGFLLAFIGFFMPVACDKNAFQLIEYVDKPSATLIIVLFILAIIGCIIGVLLLMKKDVPIGIDWIIVLASVGIGIGLLNRNELELQYGAHVIITGFSIAFIFILIASFLSDSISSNNSSSYSNNKKCRQCFTVYSGSMTACPKCGSSLYEEVKGGPSSDNSIIRPITIDDSNVEKKKCRICGTLVPADEFVCISCGGESFI